MIFFMTPTVRVILPSNFLVCDFQVSLLSIVIPRKSNSVHNFIFFPIDLKWLGGCWVGIKPALENHVFSFAYIEGQLIDAQPGVNFIKFIIYRSNAGSPVQGES